MIESLTVYGFGSFFRGSDHPNDIDLLLLHRSTQLESCKFAIFCKNQLKSALPFVDIVMLSRTEAENLDFVERAKAEQLASLRSDMIEADLQALVHRISRG